VNKLSIGTKKESGLHRALKLRYAAPGKIETPLGTYVCDGISEDGEIIEVQTGSFGPLKEKVPALSAHGKVRIVHPITVTKYIELFDITGAALHKRKSPRRGSEWDLFDKLLYAPELPLLSGLVIELVLIDVLEKRVDDGRGSWRRKGVSVKERELTAWHHIIPLEKPADYFRFIPFKKNECFTVQDLAARAGIGAKLARKTLYVLTKIGLARRIGKKGNAFVYKQARIGPKAKKTVRAGGRVKVKK
jgi:hypothetical protein